MHAARNEEGMGWGTGALCGEAPNTVAIQRSFRKFTRGRSQTRRCFSLQGTSRRAWLCRAGATTCAHRNGPAVPLGSTGRPISCNISSGEISVQQDGANMKAPRLAALAREGGREGARKKGREGGREKGREGRKGRGREGGGERGEGGREKGGGRGRWREWGGTEVGREGGRAGGREGEGRRDRGRELEGGRGS